MHIFLQSLNGFVEFALIYIHIDEINELLNFFKVIAKYIFCSKLFLSKTIQNIMDTMTYVCSTPIIIDSITDRIFSQNFKWKCQSSVNLGNMVDNRFALLKLLLF